MSLYEVTQMLQDKNAIQNDMEEAISLVRDMFYKKYLKKIQEEIENRREKIKTNRPKEIELLYALKPFMPQEKNFMIDKIAESMMMVKTLTGMQSEIKNKNHEGESIHSDGIYDVDTNCLAAKNNSFINTMMIIAMCMM